MSSQVAISQEPPTYKTESEQEAFFTNYINKLIIKINEELNGLKASELLEIKRRIAQAINKSAKELCSNKELLEALNDINHALELEKNRQHIYSNSAKSFMPAQKKDLYDLLLYKDPAIYKKSERNIDYIKTLLRELTYTIHAKQANDNFISTKACIAKILNQIEQLPANEQAGSEANALKELAQQIKKDNGQYEQPDLSALATALYDIRRATPVGIPIDEQRPVQKLTTQAITLLETSIDKEVYTTISDVRKKEHELRLFLQSCERKRSDLLRNGKSTTKIIVSVYDEYLPKIKLSDTKINTEFQVNLALAEKQTSYIQDFTNICEELIQQLPKLKNDNADNLGKIIRHLKYNINIQDIKPKKDQLLKLLKDLPRKNRTGSYFSMFFNKHKIHNSIYTCIDKAMKKLEQMPPPPRSVILFSAKPPTETTTSEKPMELPKKRIS